MTLDTILSIHELCGYDTIARRTASSFDREVAQVLSDYSSRIIQLCFEQVMDGYLSNELLLRFANSPVIGPGLSVTDVNRICELVKAIDDNKMKFGIIGGMCFQCQPDALFVVMSYIQEVINMETIPAGFSMIVIVTDLLDNLLSAHRSESDMWINELTEFYDKSWLVVRDFEQAIDFESHTIRFLGLVTDLCLTVTSDLINVVMDGFQWAQTMLQFCDDEIVNGYLTSLLKFCPKISQLTSTVIWDILSPRSLKRLLEMESIDRSILIGVISHLCRINCELVSEVYSVFIDLDSLFLELFPSAVCATNDIRVNTMVACRELWEEKGGVNLSVLHVFGDEIREMINDIVDDENEKEWTEFALFLGDTGHHASNDV